MLKLIFQFLIVFIKVHALFRIENHYFQINGSEIDKREMFNVV